MGCRHSSVAECEISGSLSRGYGGLGVSMSSDLRDLETQMAEATTATAITTTTTRTTSLSVCSTITGANSRAMSSSP